MPYEIEYTGSAIAHLQVLTARQRTIVRNGVRRHLATEPLRETRNRKLLRPNIMASWELRLGDLRVYFEVTESVVSVLAVGVKDRERVRIDGKLYLL